MSQDRKEILNGWKEIAQYISRDIRTVERWEKQRGLPVRRIPGGGRGVVYARVSELEQWLAGHHDDSAEVEEIRDASLDETPVLTVNVATPQKGHPGTIPANSLEDGMDREPAREFAEKPSSGRRVKPGKVAALSLASVLLCVGFASLYMTHGAGAEHATEAEAASAGEHRHTRVEGVNELYLRGAFALEQRTPESLEQARSSFSEATSKDANFAPAYAALAETYCLLREYARMPDAQAWTAAEGNARKALSLDPQLSDGHAVLGFVEFFWDGRTAAADHEFQTAIQLNPGSALAHHWYGSMLTHDGRLAEALLQLDIAQHLQPSSISILTQRALAIGLSGRRDEAEAMLEETLKQNRVVGDHDSSTTHLVLAILNLQPPAHLHRALSEFEHSAELRHDDGGVRHERRLLNAFDMGGPSALWRLQIELERKEHPAEVTFPTAEAEAQLGNHEQAIRDLRTILAKPNHEIVMLNTDALLDPLRGDPDFAALPGVHAVSLPVGATPGEKHAEIQ